MGHTNNVWKESNKVSKFFIIGIGILWVEFSFHPQQTKLEIYLSILKPCIVKIFMVEPLSVGIMLM